ncbi:class I SAM-dependent methyltransferase [Paenibacillus sp. y28]|uniref:class I SAM-dependent methyltransferase n=1 Tax=Paenibacillus sp. y28 TaxID=3129110 RepID=UPI003016C4FD
MTSQPVTGSALTASEFWIQAWEQAGVRDARTGSDAEEENYWQENASFYDERNPLAPYTGELMQQMISKLDPADRLLEMGPGTGGFTVLLAPHVKTITLVEPSAAMFQEFRHNWSATGYPLPAHIHSKWETAEPPQADVLFSANAVYRIRDMKESLLKMNGAAKRHIFLVQSMERPFAGPLSVTTEGVTTERERAVVMSDILHELGIAHEFRTFPVTRKNGMTHPVALIHWCPQER